VPFELHVDDGADDLGDVSRQIGCRGHFFLVTKNVVVKAPRRRR
jgi:hypothetical protein